MPVTSTTFLSNGACVLHESCTTWLRSPTKRGISTTGCDEQVPIYIYIRSLTESCNPGTAATFLGRRVGKDQCRLCTFYTDEFVLDPFALSNSRPHDAFVKSFMCSVYCLLMADTRTRRLNSPALGATPPSSSSSLSSSLNPKSIELSS